MGKGVTGSNLQSTNKNVVKELRSKMAAFVRVSGPPNSSFLVGYPGIPATLVSELYVRNSRWKVLLDVLSYAHKSFNSATN